MSNTLVIFALALIMAVFMSVWAGYRLGKMKGAQLADDTVYFERANKLLAYCSLAWYYYFKEVRSDSRTADYVAQWFKTTDAAKIENEIENSASDRKTLIGRIRRKKL